MSRAVAVRVNRANRTTYRETTYVESNGDIGRLQNDPIGDRFRTNEDLFDDNDILQTIHGTLCNALMSRGYVFRRGEQWLVPTGLFESVLRTYWRAIPSKALRFLMCNGFLVWFVYRTPEGVSVPDIPERDKLQVDYEEDTKTGVDYVHVRWVNADTRSRLYIIQSGLSMCSDGRKGRAPVDKVKNLLRRYYLVDDSKIIATYRGARPPEIVQPVGMSRKVVSRNDDMPVPGSTTDRAMTYDEFQNYDAMMYNNLNYEIDEARRLFRPTSNNVVRPHMRLQAELDQPREANLMRIPSEMQHASWNAPLPLADVPETLRILRAQIFATFGVPHNIHPRSTARIGADKETEVSDEVYENTLRAVGDDCTIFLTSMYRLLYDTEDLQLSDVKRTATEQAKRIIKNDDELEDKDLLTTNMKAHPHTEMMLMEHAMESETAAQSFYEQGRIAGKTLYDRHPHLLEEERDDRQARIEEERDERQARLAREDAVHAAKKIKK